MNPRILDTRKTAAASKRYARWLNAQFRHSKDAVPITRLLERLRAERLQPAARNDRVRFYRLPLPHCVAGCLIAEMDGRFYSEEDLINALQPTTPRRTEK